ncbi:MAG: YihY/virulence factor BrkB family protein [Planctomycetaceae bacterium]|nr:YihY/virulence factor BrkB family protein [Planctomycetaceae bacterium]
MQWNWPKWVNRPANFLAKTFREFGKDDCTMMAASLAYYAMFSIPPLLLIVITATGMIWGQEAVRGYIETELARMLGEAGKDQVLDMVRSAETSSSGILATLTSTGLLLFGATGVMSQLQAALNRVWQIEPDPEQGGIQNFLIKRLLSFGMVMAIAFLLLVSLILTTIMSTVVKQIGGYLPDALSTAAALGSDVAVTLIVITCLLAALFKWVPDAEITWKDVGVGAAVTAVLFVIGKSALGWYLGSKDPSSYGTAGALVLLLMWVYYTTMIVLYGAEFTQVWANEYGRDIVPESGAVRVKREKVVDHSPGPPGVPQPSMAYPKTPT